MFILYKLTILLIIVCLSPFQVLAAEGAAEGAEEESTLLSHTLEGLSPKGTIDLAEAYAGKVILAVNTASGCGFTPQYEGLETLYQKYQSSGLVVLGFPSNDFYQEPKQGDDIVEFCRLNYRVSFPIFKKSSVKGKKANSFYQALATASDGKSPRWNFFKYLIDQDQKLVGVYSSQEKPLGGKIEAEIEKLLNRDSLTTLSPTHNTDI